MGNIVGAWQSLMLMAVSLGLRLKRILDWYERWLDEVIAGEVNGWLGHRMGGAEEHLLDKYAYAHENEVKLDCLEGLLYKKALKPQSMVQVENWLAQEAVSVQHMRCCCRYCVKPIMSKRSRICCNGRNGI